MHDSGDSSTLMRKTLWAEVQSSTTFVPYRSATFNTDGTQVTDLTIGESKICLGCHDGVVASDVAATTAKLQSDEPGGVAVGKHGNLGNDHPIGFDYNYIAQLYPNLRPATTLWVGGNRGRAVKDSLYLGKYLTCATCHDIHNNFTVGDGEGSHNYLVYSRQSGSTLCLTCHDF